MKEEFLYFLWNNRLLDFKQIEEDTGIVFQHFGFRNTNSGPDFSQVKFTKDGIVWVGAMEMHLKSSDWNLHFHHQDQNYNSVVLHLVWEHNQDVFTVNQDVVFTLEVQKYVPVKYIENQERFFKQSSSLCCSDQIKDTSTLVIRSMLENTFIERIEQKSWNIQVRYSRNANDLQETMYQTFAYAWGLKINAEPFEELARRVPSKLISKHRDQPFQLLAIYLGTAGFLEDEIASDYFKKLKQEFQFFKTKYKLLPMLKESWLMGKVRYPYFPVFSIVLFCHILLKIKDWNHLFFQFEEKEFEQIFDVNLDSYWQQHYDFNKTHSRSFSIGYAKVETMILNAVLPLIFFYGRTFDTEVYEQLENIAIKLKPETNHITKLFSSLLKLENGKDSQAVLELYKNYCEPKKCLACRIGNEILKR